MFLGGFKSDMNGTKAIHLEQQCKKRGQEFIRFDYSGHGKSDGNFVNGTISSWKNDAMAILDNIIKTDVILVGSSMGGWISLLLLLERSDRIKGVIGIAAAPDFTKDIEKQLTYQQLEEMKATGQIEIPNDYSDEPYIFTRALIKDGEKQFLLGNSYNISTPITLIQGKLDSSVHWKTTIKIKECFNNEKTEIIFINDGDHRLSRDQDLKILDEQIIDMSHK